MAQDHTDAEDRHQVVLDLLEAHPDALVNAISPTGNPARWPSGLVLGSHHLVEDATPMEIIVPDDLKATSYAWTDANRKGRGDYPVRLLGDPDRYRTLSVIDLRATDGVFVAIVPSETVAGEPLPVPDVPVYAPHHAVVRESGSTVILGCDDAYVRMMGRPRDLLLGRSGADLVYPDDIPIAVEASMEMRAKGRSEPRRWRLIHADGSLRWGEVFFVRDTNERGEMEVIVDITDVTEEVNARENLEAQELRLNRIVQVVPVGLFEVEGEDRVTYANEALHRMLERSSTLSLADIVASVVPTDRGSLLSAIARVRGSGADEDVEVEVRTVRTNEPRRCLMSVRALTNRVGAIVAVIVSVSDVTEVNRRLVQLERDVIHRSFYDALTGLPNRTLLITGMEEAIAESRQTGDVVAVLMVDVDGFKAVNDTLGHSLGDELLRVMSDRLRALARTSDLVARVGGDEFAILTHDFIDPDHPTRLAGQILTTLSQPCEIDGHPLQTGVSIGIATNITASGTEELLRDADLAMFRAKAAGRGRYELFEPHMHAALAARVELETSLRRAVDARQLIVVYQPIHDLNTGDVTGAEALVRWQHPVRGVVPPDEFVPLAEETGLIVAIGRLVLDEACTEAAGWVERRGRSAPTLSVNLSARQLASPSVVDDVGRALAHSGLDPARLTVEITESVLMELSEANVELLADLRQLGVSLAMDDFGTGYSSLAYLERLPLDIVKIDKIFVDRIGHGGRHDKLIRGILALTSDLGLSTTAEGIETERQLRALRSLGCPKGQGYLFSRPMSAEAMWTYLTTSGSGRP